MSRRNRKKAKTIQLPFTMRHDYACLWLRFKLWFPSIVYALRLPALTLFVYLLMCGAGVFSVYYSGLHVAAAFVFALWFVQAVRGAVGYWTHRAHLRFFLPLVLLVGVGSCWADFRDYPIKAWVTPPAYAQLPSEVLQPGMWAQVPAILEGSQIHVSWKDESRPVHVRFGEQKEVLEFFGIKEPVATFQVPVQNRVKTYELMAHAGWLRVGQWRLATLPDTPPRIGLLEEPQITVRKTIRFAFSASDDFGVEKVFARLVPAGSGTLESVKPVEIPLRSPQKKQVETVSYIDLTFLPWADIPVTVQLVAIDGVGQKGYSAPKIVTLPSRKFNNPFARALIEQRDKLLQQPDTAVQDETANIMAGIARQQTLFHGDPAVLMSLRAGAVRLVVGGSLADVESVASILWQAAVRLEEGAVGRARRDFAQAEEELSLALKQPVLSQALQPYLNRMEKAMLAYFRALEEECARQSPSLQEVDWPLVSAREGLSPEDVALRLRAIRLDIAAGEKSEALDKLSDLREVIENLRTTPPELTPSQAMIARQVAALRALVRGQEELTAGFEKLMLTERKSWEGSRQFLDGLAHQVAQQQILLSILHDVMTQAELKSIEAKASQLAMQGVLKAIHEKEWNQVQKKQAEALALLQNSLLALTEQMKSAFAVQMD